MSSVMPATRSEAETAVLLAWSDPDRDPARTTRRIVEAVQRARSIAIDAFRGDEDAAHLHEPELWGDRLEEMLVEMASNPAPTNIDVMNYLAYLDAECPTSHCMRVTLTRQGLHFRTSLTVGHQGDQYILAARDLLAPDPNPAVPS